MFQGDNSNVPQTSSQLHRYNQKNLPERLERLTPGSRTNNLNFSKQQSWDATSSTINTALSK